MRRFTIISASKLYDYESALDKLRKENDELREENSSLKHQIRKMTRGERACGQHCEGCKHAYVKQEVMFAFGLVDRTYGCKLDGQTACPHFAAKV